MNCGRANNKIIFTNKSSIAGSMEGIRADLLLACKYSLNVSLPKKEINSIMMNLQGRHTPCIKDREEKGFTERD